MWKLLALFLVFVFVSVSIKDSNATTTPSTTFDRLVWTAGSAVNVTFGPEDAVYCRLKDNMGTIVFDGFGPCRVVLDRVTKKHRGYWELFVGAPGTVIVRSSWVDVEVAAAVDFTPAVATSWVDQRGILILKCSIPGEYQVQSCIFRIPATTILNELYQKSPLLIAGPGVGVPVLKAPEGFSGTEGDAVTMSCYIGAPVRYCYFRAPNGTVFNVGPSTSSADYEYVGNGFDAGECGIRFKNISTSATGLRWSCNVGLTNIFHFEEKNAFFKVNIYERTRVYTECVWEGSAVVVHISAVNTENKVEYCRLVRSDGLGFVSKKAPFPYVLEVIRDGYCSLFIPRPVAEDWRPWTVVIKVIGEDEERSVTTTLVTPSQSTRGLSPTAATVLWSLFGTIFVFLILASCLPKKNRDWTHQRAVLIRNSFRRQPQPQPTVQNVADLPNPVHTDILTDLPRKV